MSSFGPDHQACTSWANFTDAGAGSDTFNTASVSDTGTGTFTITTSDAHDSSRFCISYCAMNVSAPSSARGIFGTLINSTTEYRTDTRNADGNETDHQHNMTITIGDY